MTEYGPAQVTDEELVLMVLEERLAAAARILITAAQARTPLRRDLLALAGTVQALQRRALEQAGRR